MRWSYLIPRLIIVGLIWAFFAFGFDPALRYGATQTLQSVTGAKADIRQLTTGFFPPRMSIDGVALASARKPGTNLVQFDRMNLRLAGQPLLRRCYVVDEAVVTGVRFNTSRNDSGQLEYQEEHSGGPLIPPWLAEKLKNAGDEWLEEFTQQAKGQLDPNLLESYRVGNEVYVKWDNRFKDINARVRTTKAEVESLKQQIELAKSGDTVQQIERYLQIAQRADLLSRQSRSMISEFNRTIGPEIKQDFARLDQAQKNDRANVAHTISLLKPDPRRITESLIGEQMYLQLQHMLTWVETLRAYQGQFATPEPERHRGRDFAFEILNPTPGMLCKKMLIDGELMLGDVPTPFQAVLTDVTSDPKLHGRPAMLQVSTAGETPVEVVVRHDATTDIAQTHLAAEFTDRSKQQLSAGRAGGDQLLASISDMHWKARLTVVQNQISGQVDVASRFGDAELKTTSTAAATLAGLTERTLGGISTVNATLTLNGPVARPDISVTSDLGPQIVSGFQASFQAFVPEMQAQLGAVVEKFVAQKKQDLIAELGGRHSELLADNEKLLATLGEAQKIATDLRSGKVDPNRVFRMASDTGVLKGKNKDKVDRYLGRQNDVLKGLRNPEKTIQDALPGLSRKLFR